MATVYLYISLPYPEKEWRFASLFVGDVYFGNKANFIYKFIFVMMNISILSFVAYTISVVSFSMVLAFAIDEWLEYKDKDKEKDKDNH